MLSRVVKYLGVIALAGMCLSAKLAPAASLAVQFDGNALSENRRGTTEGGRWVEFARRGDAARETLTIRELPGRTLKTELQQLVRAVRARHPEARLRLLERSGGHDVIASYLLTPDKGDVSLVLWRFTEQNGLVATIYRLDFPFDDVAAQNKILNHTAERSFGALDPAALKQLLN
jgi:hypothetical protein